MYTRSKRPGSSVVAKTGTIGTTGAVQPNFSRGKNADNMADILQTINNLQEQSDKRLLDYDAIKEALLTTQKERDELLEKCQQVQDSSHKQGQVRRLGFDP